jgi:hypothetical protein
MPRCPHCGYFLPEERERVGSRCPHCRSPLYLPADRIARAARDGEAACTAHPASVAVGTCGRCGNFLCETCRTRWGDAVVCTACLERALRPGADDRTRKVAHSRRAAFGLAGGLAAWLLTGVVFLVAFLAIGKNAEENRVAAMLVGMCVLLCFPAAVVVALVGLGQAAAALRTRGDSMIVATLGFLLSGLHVGAAVGIILFEVWQR